MSDKKEDCFVIMPISDCEGYNSGHFTRVYEDIIKPAVFQAEFNPIRGDEVAKTNLIQLDILKKLLETPIAICDLSSRNPNVLFELGIRQAFDMPVVLIQEKGTPKIFDITPLRYIEYSREMGYRDVIEGQRKITAALKDTFFSKDEVGNVNSIVKLLALNSAASIPTVKGDSATMKTNLILSQISDLNSKVDMLFTKEKNSNYDCNNLLIFFNKEVQDLDETFTTAQFEHKVHLINDDDYLLKLSKMKRNLFSLKNKFGIINTEYDNLMRKIRQEIVNVRNSN
ncbi:hypothetical protein [Bacteroides thetaiotaomicron]|uniref:hypothetical protein n=1 Tax=Bacteroides thetaiotaomicron TaxID=818 RepID=UPI0039C2B41A